MHRGCDQTDSGPSLSVSMSLNTTWLPSRLYDDRDGVLRLQVRCFAYVRWYFGDLSLELAGGTQLFVKTRSIREPFLRCKVDKKLY